MQISARTPPHSFALRAYACVFMTDHDALLLGVMLLLAIIVNRNSVWIVIVMEISAKINL